MFSIRAKKSDIFDINKNFMQKYSKAGSMFGMRLANLREEAESFWILLAQILSESSDQISQSYEPEDKFDGYDELLEAFMSLSIEDAKKKIRAYFDFVSITLNISTPDFVNKDFYFWFFSIAFSVLLNNASLREDDFKNFVQLFSSDLLLEIHTEATLLINTPLFLSLSSSTFSGARERFCFVAIAAVDSFNLKDDRNKIYNVAVNFLMNLYSNKIFSEDLDVEVAILLRLLFSVRTDDRSLSEIAIKNRYNSALLMSKLFCSDFLLQALTFSENTQGIFVDSTMIFDLLQGAIRQNTDLCSQFNTAMKRSQVNVDISNLTVRASIQYFAMLDSDNQRCITWIEVNRAKRVWRARAQIRTHEVRREAFAQFNFLDFIMSVFRHLERPNNLITTQKLFDFFDKINRRSRKTAVLMAKVFLSYLVLREALYGEDIVLKKYAVELNQYIELFKILSIKYHGDTSDEAHENRLISNVALSVTSGKQKKCVYFAEPVASVVVYDALTPIASALT